MMAVLGVHSSYCSYLWKNAFNTFFSQCNYHHTSESLIDLTNFKENFLDSQQLTAAAWGCMQMWSFIEKCEAVEVTNTRKRPLNYCM